MRTKLGIGKRQVNVVVSIVVGSAADMGSVAETEKVLKEFGVKYWLTVASAHRTPLRLRMFIRDAEDHGTKVFIAGAGGAAALPGAVAAETTRPVIGIPVLTKALKGLDSLLSIAQMPAGIPVACMAVGMGGARNAGLLAVSILALEDSTLTRKLLQYRKKQTTKVRESVKEISRARRRLREIYVG